MQTAAAATADQVQPTQQRVENNVAREKQKHRKKNKQEKKTENHFVRVRDAHSSSRSSSSTPYNYCITFARCDVRRVKLPCIGEGARARVFVCVFGVSANAIIIIVCGGHLLETVIMRTLCRVVLLLLLGWQLAAAAQCTINNINGSSSQPASALRERIVRSHVHTHI